MKIKELNPNQIITLNDYPVYNEHILKIFFKIFKEGYGKIIPPCLVIHKKLVIPVFNKNYNLKFKEFEKINLKAEYFLLDGSHKTTAATLTKNKIKVMIFENNKDIKEAKNLADIGELYNFTLPKTIKENIEILKKHFYRKKGFQTVENKTKRMIKEKAIPRYMIRS
ncbi:MAG: hypothetical protein PHE43_01230 [Candidatus Nanoarchaeia archaeon]|nr:hypothetical protein [Candidatus Nanoarchaeia archaeon]